eukprot:3288910-Alexandrium_andersonii.AAC.1
MLLRYDLAKLVSAAKRPGDSLRASRRVTLSAAVASAARASNCTRAPGVWAASGRGSCGPLQSSASAAPTCYAPR